MPRSSCRSAGTFGRTCCLHPGSVAFGEIEQGKAAERTVSVSYSGRSDWAIVDVRSANSSFEVELLDGERNFGRVTYKMLVRLKVDAPTGYLQDQLTIVTNDSYNGSLELPVEGRIVSPLTVSPASLFLGVLKPGETVEKKLFVKGTKPFKIVSIECEGDCFKFQTSDKATAAHMVPLTFTAGNAPGKISQKIEIKTDLGTGATTTCLASATITEPSESEKLRERPDESGVAGPVRRMAFQGRPGPAYCGNRIGKLPRTTVEAWPLDPTVRSVGDAIKTPSIKMRSPGA